MLGCGFKYLGQHSYSSEFEYLAHYLGLPLVDVITCDELFIA